MQERNHRWGIDIGLEKNTHTPATMGKRNNTTMSGGRLEAQENEECNFTDQKTSKRLRTTSDATSPPQHNTAAALTLLSLKKKAVCFQPPSPFP
jgi:hypothetical protein